MTLQRKFVETCRSSKDKSIYNILYPAPTNILMAKLVSTVEVASFIKMGAQLGYIQESQDHKNFIQAPISGTVVQIKPIQALNVKGKMLHIFSIKQCQHFPKDKNQGLPQNLILPQSSSILQTADICAYCELQIWFYYEKTQVQINYRQLKKSFDQFNFSDFQWKISLNQQYTKETQIGGTYDQSYTIRGSGKVTFLYQFSKNQPSPQTIVLKYKKVVCKHEKISSGICVFCLTDIKSLKNLNLRRYLFQFDEQRFNSHLLLSGKALQDQATQFKNKLIQNQKALLVLDLDNTILHSVSLRRVSQEMMKQIQQYAIIPSNENISVFIQKTLVKFRPNFQYFLTQIVKYYEIFIYTKGTRAYAEEICRIVKNKYPDILKGTNNFLPHRIISRDQDPNLGKKNLEFLIPKNRQIILILDDRRDVWNHSPLCVFTRPYLFFFVEMTQNGKTKIEPVQWQKGGGSLQHKLNQFEQKCVKQIEQAQKQGKQQQVVKKIAQLQQQILISEKNQQSKSNIVACPAQNIAIFNYEQEIQLKKRNQNIQNKQQQNNQPQEQQKQIIDKQKQNDEKKQQIQLNTQKNKQQLNSVNQVINQKKQIQNQSSLLLGSNNLAQNSRLTKTQTDNNHKVKQNLNVNQNLNENINRNHLPSSKDFEPPNMQMRELKNNSGVPDQYLVTTTFALKQAHNIYFQKLSLKDDEHKKQGKFADLSICFQEYKKTVLDHLSVFFIARDYKKLGSYRRSQKLGLKIVQNTCQKIDLIIRPNNLIQGYSEAASDRYYQMIVKKLKSMSQPKKIPIVSQMWIDICYQYNCCIHHSYFEPADPYVKQIFKEEAQIVPVVGSATVATAKKIKILLQKGYDENYLKEQEDRNQNI